MYGLYQTTEGTENTTDDVFNNSKTVNHNQIDNRMWDISRLMIITTFPIIIIVGTIGNLLTFIIMQRGSLRNSSTCFYMAMLAIGDTSK